MSTYEHIPVLLNEVLRYLDPRPGQNFVDATLGGGGYTAAILEKTIPGGKVLAIDLDEEAIENFNDKNPESRIQNTFLVHGNFAQIDRHVEGHGFANISGIVADLGLSSHELSSRGMSFQEKQPLDMRFNLSQKEDAKFVLNTYDERRLRKIFEDYGEENFAGKIAKKILEYRIRNSELKYTTDLYQIIQESLPKPVKHKAADHARRIFQALRIEVNQELQSLEDFLPKAFDVLAPGGRMAIVSFHSLEDRMVKKFFAALGRGCVCPPDFPQCLCGKNPRARVLTKKPVMPSEAELATNSRSRPAKLRVVEKN